MKKYFQRLLRVGLEDLLWCVAKLEATDKVEYSPSEHETVWMFPHGIEVVVYVKCLDENVAVFIGVHFNEQTDEIIAKLILTV